MVLACVLVLAGGLAAQHTTVLPGSDVLYALLVASICACRWRPLRPVAGVLCGAALFMLAGARVADARLDAHYAGDSMLATVRVTASPEKRNGSAVFFVESLGDARIPGRARVSWFEPPVMPMLGEVWEFELRLVRPRGTANPGVFDYETWLFREKVHATGYVVPGKRNRLLWSGTASVRDAFRSRFVARARAAADSDAAAAVLAAVGTGSRHRLSRDQWERFAATGTSHLMAISGLHVGLAATFAFAVAFVATGFLPIRVNRVLLAIIAGVLAAAAYAWVSGLGVPARRAVLMLAVSGGMLACRRPVDPAVVVAVAALAVFVTDPIATLAPGFHLSFVAVVLLLWLARRHAPRGRRLRPIVAARQLFTLQVFLLFGLLPLTAAIFQRFVPVATPVNLLAVPLFSFLTAPLTLAGLALGEWSEGTAMIFLRLAAYSIDGLDAIIAWAAGLPFGHMDIARLAGCARLLLVVPLAWVVLPPGWPARHIAVIGVLAVVSWKPSPPPAECFDSWVLDVGQGLAVVVRTRKHVLLYDTGMAWRSGGSVARLSIAPFLAAQGIDRIDQLVVSHADLDHSGGLGELRSQFEVAAIVTGEPLDGVDAWQCRAGQSWWSGAIRFAMLHPGGAGLPEGNDASCVLRVAAGPHALLLTGDIEAVAERAILKRGEPLGADIVVVPHHGSLTSSSMPFVDAVEPDVAIVSAAYRNRWGLPKTAVVGRWRANGAEVLNTARDGAVFLRTCASGGVARLRREREERRRFWHARD